MAQVEAPRLQPTKKLKRPEAKKTKCSHVDELGPCLRPTETFVFCTLCGHRWYDENHREEINVSIERSPAIGFLVDTDEEYDGPGL